MHKVTSTQSLYTCNQFEKYCERETGGEKEETTTINNNANEAKSAE